MRLRAGEYCCRGLARTSNVALRFRGIEFARWEDGRVLFGLADHFEQLNPEKRSALHALVHKLLVHRIPRFRRFRPVTAACWIFSASRAAAA